MRCCPCQHRERRKTPTPPPVATHHHQRGTRPTDFWLWPPEKACCEILPGSCHFHALSHALGGLITNQSRRVPGDSFLVPGLLGPLRCRCQVSTTMGATRESPRGTGRSPADRLDFCRPKLFHSLRQTDSWCRTAYRLSFRIRRMKFKMGSP